MDKSIEWWRVVPMRHHFDIAFISDIQHKSAAIDITHIRAIWTIRKHIGVVRAKACVEFLGETLWWWRLIAFACTGIPPTTNLNRLGRIRDIQDAIKLVIQWIARLEISRTRRHMQIVAIDKPHRMHTS